MTVSSANRLRVYMRDNATCTLCGEHVEPEDYEVDHILERELGGSDNPDNLRCVHSTCHSERHHSYLYNRYEIVRVRVPLSVIHGLKMLSAVRRVTVDEIIVASLVRTVNEAVELEVIREILTEQDATTPEREPATRSHQAAATVAGPLPAQQQEQ